MAERGEFVTNKGWSPADSPRVLGVPFGTIKVFGFRDGAEDDWQLVAALGDSAPWSAGPAPDSDAILAAVRLPAVEASDIDEAAAKAKMWITSGVGELGLRIVEADYLVDHAGADNDVDVFFGMLELETLEGEPPTVREDVE